MITSFALSNVASFVHIILVCCVYLLHRVSESRTVTVSRSFHLRYISLTYHIYMHLSYKMCFLHFITVIEPRSLIQIKKFNSLLEAGVSVVG
jgi:hypothetical protein